jgi:Protein of unknown function (DUF2631)
VAAEEPASSAPLDPRDAAVVSAPLDPRDAAVVSAPLDPRDAAVTSPDQHKPGPIRAARIGAVLVVVVLLMMLCGNHKGRIEDYFLVATAGTIVAVLVGDWLLRKNGLR